MARDVEVNVTANDKTGPGLSSAERAFKRSQDRLKKQQDDTSDRLGKGLLKSIDTVSPKLAESLAKMFQGVSQYAGPVLAVGIAAATPVIGATVSAAVAAGVGVGVAGIGVALVAQDARVKAAGGQLGKSLMSSLQRSASPFIQPVLESIDKIQSNFNKLTPTIDRLFGNASKFVAPLVDGINIGVTGLVNGVDRLVAKSGPVIDELGQSIGKLGTSLGDFLGGIDTKNAAGAISDLTTNITSLLAVTGLALNGLTHLYGFFRQAFTNGDTKFVARTAGAVDDLGLSFEGASDDATDYAAGLREAEAAVQAVYQANLSLYQSTTDVGKALLTADEAAKENGRTLSANTKKGQANRDALAQVAGALQRNYDGYVKVNGEGAGASKLAGQLRGKFVALAEKMGASSGKARQLADDLLGIPNVKRDVTVRTDAARNAAEALKAKLASIKNRTVYVSVAFNEGRLNKVEAQLSRINHAGLAGDTGWERTAGGAGSRTGGAAAINVQNAISVALDGRPFRDMTATAIVDNNRRQAWRNKVSRH